MTDPIAITSAAVLASLNLPIAFYDIRYRRIPNILVIGVLFSGIGAHVMIGGSAGLWDSLSGCLLAFILMLAVRFLTGLGAGDVKLFGAIGALLGSRHVVPAFLLVVLLGGAMAMVAMLRAKVARQTMLGVCRIFAGMLPGGIMPPREDFARTGLTIPYGIAVTGGSLLQMLSVLMGR
jgi:prepilin peptidase CpaA